MKALTLTQPWATLVASGAKRIETRSWSTSYRGPLLIHAAKGFPKWAQDLCVEMPFCDDLHDWWPDVAAHLPRGVIVAACLLLDIEPTAVVHRRLDAYGHDDELEYGDYGPNRFAWHLSQVEPLREPIPCRGYQQLWVPPDDVLAQVRAQLGKAVLV